MKPLSLLFHVLFITKLVCIHPLCFGQSELFISEYVESTDDKCIEIFNPTLASISLDGTYRLRMSASGNPPITLSNLSGTIAPLDVHVVCSYSTNFSYDQSWGAAGPNGNDAIILEKNGSPIDIFGNAECPTDPLFDAWTDGGLSTADMTLVRQHCIDEGVSDNPGGDCTTFPTLASEWVGFPVGDLSHLGHHDFFAGQAQVETTLSDCGKKTGSISIAAIGSNLVFSIDGGINYSDQPHFANLAPGTYDVIAQMAGANTCAFSETVAISEANIPSITNIWHTDPNDCGANSGSITIQTDSPHVEISLDQQYWQRDLSFDKLFAGLYDISARLTDFPNCIAQVSQILSDPPHPQALIANWSDPSCSGIASGVVEIEVSKGSGDYMYQWYGPTDPGDVSSSSKLMSGDYKVNISDKNAPSCITDVTITLEDPPLFYLSIEKSDEQIAGAMDGYALVKPNNGESPIKYIWSHGDEGNTVQNLSPGTYSVTATDNRGCISEATITIEPGTCQMTLASVISQPTCAESNNGQIEVLAEKYIGNLEAEWDHDANNSSLIASNLSSKTYNVLIRDEAGCTASASFEMEAPTPLLATLTTTGLSAPNASDASIQAEPSGGTPPYRYSWNTGANTPTIQDLPPGQYTVTITDQHDCSIVRQANISEIECRLSAAIQEVAPSCHKSGNGSITVDAEGDEPFSYQWSHDPNLTDATASNLEAGEYHITIEDASQCQITETVVLTAPTPLLATLTTTGLSAPNASDASIQAEPSGGTPPYRYSWNTGANTPTIQDLPPGQYTVTITDQHDCSIVRQANISEIECRLSATIQEVAPSCHKSGNGSITVDAEGDEPFSYQWSHDTNLTDATASNLEAGEYHITIEDASQCQITETVALTAPTPLVATLTTTGLSAPNASDASIQAEPSGGTPPYRYSWNTGANTPTIQDLPPGQYTVTITDQHDCSIVRQANISEIECRLSATIQEVAPSCHKSGNGSITVDAEGDEPFSYQWSHDTNLTDATASNLEAGEYHITIEDASHCQIIKTVALTAPTPLVATLTTTGLSAPNASDASIQAEPSGGTPPYRYEWNTGANTPTIQDLPPGQYTVTITDQHDCSIVRQANISEVECRLSATIQEVSPSCHESGNGSITVDAEGDEPFSYQWSHDTNLTDATASNLEAGEYHITIEDASHCQITETVALTAPTPLVATLTTTGLSAPNASDASIQAEPSGGTPPYRYSWNTGANTPTIQDLPPGQYTVTITDQHDCSIVRQANISEVECRLSATIQKVSPSCHESGNGSITVDAEGDEPFSYQWSHDPNLTDATASNLEAGEYHITIEDASHCQITETVALIAPEPLSIDLLMNDGQTKAIEIIVTGGTPNYNAHWSDGHEGLERENIPDGSHHITLSDANGCDTTFHLEMQPYTCELDFELKISAPSCADDHGEVTVIPYSGATPFMIWMNGLEYDVLSVEVEAGKHNITITDANGCSSTREITVPTVDPLTAEWVITHQTISGVANGVAQVFVEGGSAPFNYLWSTGDIGSKMTGLAPGTYHVTITDSLGCQIQASTIINAVDCALGAEIQTHQALCAGDTGKVKIVIHSGKYPFKYSWSENDNWSDSIQRTLIPGRHRVMVTDAQGCSQELSYITDSITSINVDYLIQKDESGRPYKISATAKGGVPPYQYAWNNEDSTAEIEIDGEGLYQLLVTDQNLCVKLVDIWVETPDEVCNISLSAVIKNTGCDLPSGSIDLHVENAQDPNYFWSHDTSHNAASVDELAEGTYFVSVRDGQCTVEKQFEIEKDSVVPLSYTMREDCNSQVTLLTLADPGGFTSEVTYFLDGAEVGTNKEVEVTPGEHTLYAEGSNGCHSEVTIRASTPREIIHTPDTVIDLGNQLVLKAISSDPGSISYQTWMTKDSMLCSTCHEVVIAPKESKEYIYSLVDTSGCVLERSIMVWVRKHSGIYIPNAYTPNGDGNNDAFIVFDAFDNIKVIRSLQIFDRRGVRVYWQMPFETNTEAPHFNDILSQSIGPHSFVYVLDVVMADGTIQKWTGDFVLLR